MQHWLIFTLVQSDLLLRAAAQKHIIAAVK
jgi:hypothetical protein